MKRMAFALIVIVLLLASVVGLTACGEKDPEFEVPADLTVAYGLTLGDLPLPAGFSWQDEATTSVGDVGQNTFLVTYTPEDTDKYKTVTDIEVTVTVTKADPAYTAPKNLTATYGQTLSSVALPAGFAWKTPNASVGNAGRNVFAATYTPADTAKYNVVGTVNLTVTVEKAAAVIDVRSAVTAFTYDGTVKSVTGATGTGAITYENNAFTNAGTYRVRVLCAESDNYLAGETTVTATVAKAAAVIDVQNAVTAFTYDGTAKSVTGATGTGAITYENNAFTDAGTYQVRVLCAESDNYLAGETTVTATVASAELAGLTFAGDTFLYDGTAKSLSVAGDLPDGVSVQYTNNEKINAGSYDVVAHFVDATGNYTLPQDMTATMVIAKATYDLTAVTFANASFTYDGTAKSLAIAGDLPAGVTVQYQNNGKINAGAYEVTAVFAGDATNYNAIPDKTATLTVAPRPITVTADDREQVYGESAKALTYATSGALLAGNAFTGSLTRASGNTVGTYAITQGTLTVTDNYAVTFVNGTYTITKATYDLSAVTFANGSFTYDGTAKSLSVAGDLPDGVSVQYTNNDKINAGAYEVTAVFTGDATNYNAIPDKTATLTVGKRTATVEWTNTEAVFDGTAHTPTATVTNKATESDEVVVSVKGNGYTTVGGYGWNATFMSLSGKDANNYELNAEESVSLHITRATLSDVSVSQNGALTYTGDAQRAEVEASAVSAGERAVTFTYADAEDGVYTGDVPAFTNAGAHVVYYKAAADDHWTATGTFTVTIAKAQGYLNTTGSTRNFTYDGNKHMIEGLTRVSGSFTYTVGEEPCDGYVDAGTYPITVNVEESANYLGGTWTLYLEIAPADLTAVSVSQDGSLTYNGEEQSANVTAVATSVADREVTFAYSADADGEYVADLPVFTDAGAYTVYYEATAPDHNATRGEFTVTIGKRTLQISWENASVTYDGTAHLPTASITNKAKEADEVTVALTADGVVNVGGYGWSKTYMVLSGEDANNYKIHDAEQAPLQITAVGLTVTADTIDLPNGEDPTFTATITGFVAGEDESVLDGELAFACAYENTVSGEYEITPSGLTSDNYAITFVKGTLIVHKPVDPDAEEKVTPTGLEATYGDTLADVELPAGWEWVENEDTPVGNAGDREHDVKYVQEDYDDIVRTATIAVAKADLPAEEIPTELRVMRYKANIYLEELTTIRNEGHFQCLPEGWTVDTSYNNNTTISESARTYKFRFDDDNYNTIRGHEILITPYIPSLNAEITDAWKARLTEPYDGNNRGIDPTKLIVTDTESGLPVTIAGIGNGFTYSFYRESTSSNVNYANTAGDYTLTVTIPNKNSSPYYHASKTITWDFTIPRADMNLSFAQEEYEIGLNNVKESNLPQVSGVPGAVVRSYTREFKPEGADDEEYTTTYPTTMGRYVYRVTVREASTTVNYNDSSATTILVVGKNSPNLSISNGTYMAGATNYDNQRHETYYRWVVRDGGYLETLTYEYKVQDADDDTYTTEIPTTVGTYTVRATAHETETYAAQVVTATITLVYGNSAFTYYDEEEDTTLSWNYYGSAYIGIVYYYEGEHAKEDLALLTPVSFAYASSDRVYSYATKLYVRISEDPEVYAQYEINDGVVTPFTIGEVKFTYAASGTWIDEEGIEREYVDTLLFTQKGEEKLVWHLPFAYDPEDIVDYSAESMYADWTRVNKTTVSMEILSGRDDFYLTILFTVGENNALSVDLGTNRYVFEYEEYDDILDIMYYETMHFNEVNGEKIVFSYYAPEAEIEDLQNVEISSWTIVSWSEEYDEELDETFVYVGGVCYSIGEDGKTLIPTEDPGEPM